MAKNKPKKFDYKNIKINEEELSITKIGEITTASQNPLFILFVFVFLLAFIFFLPTIVNFLNGSREEVTSGQVNNNKKEENENNSTEEEEKEQYYEISDSLVIPLEEKLTARNFKLENQILSFTISNSSENRFFFNRHNYFLEIYNEENTLLERIILKKEIISKESNMDFSYPVLNHTASNMKKISFVEKEIADYPNVELKANELNESSLTCLNTNETITYKFVEEKLQSITDVYNYIHNATDSLYENQLNDWKQKVAVYNNLTGVSSTFIESGNGFVVNTVIDLSNAKVATLENEYYYDYETLAKVVKFEMEARGFVCN